MSDLLGLTVAPSAGTALYWSIDQTYAMNSLSFSSFIYFWCVKIFLKEVGEEDDQRTDGGIVYQQILINANLKTARPSGRAFCGRSPAEIVSLTFRHRDSSV